MPGCCGRGDCQGLAGYLLRGTRNLSNAGAQFAAQAGITPHVVFDEVSAASPIPLASMVETSCGHDADKGYRRVGLPGTGPTMRGTSFQEAFPAGGIETAVPGGEEMQYIAGRIEREVEYGVILPGIQEGFSGEWSGWRPGTA